METTKNKSKKKEKANDNEGKKKEGWHLYNLFKRSKGFDRNSESIPLIVSEPIEWLIQKNGIK